MNLATFFDHWKIAENPFKGEEARQDPVFWRLEGIPGPTEPAGAKTSTAGLTATTHPDFEKILGELTRPSTAIVFGEKGSGKTAIRIQLTDRIAAYNRANPQAKCLLIPYDDLNPILDRFCERTPAERKGKNAPPESPLMRFRLVDHIDAMLSIVVPRLVDAVLRERRDERAGTARAGGHGSASPTDLKGGEPAPAAGLDLGDDARKRIRKMEVGFRHDVLLLQSMYDRPERADIRTRRLRRTLRLSVPTGVLIWTVLAYLGWAVPGALVYVGLTRQPPLLSWPPVPDWFVYSLLGATALYLGALIKRSVYDRLRYISLGHRVRKQVRVISRGDASFGRSIRELPPSLVDSTILPMTSAEEPRYDMLDRLQRVLRPFGYTSMLLVVDRVDEPTAIGGDPERMRAVMWPLLNNKFLQHAGLGVKMLLPMELRHALFRESSSFFQEARLDKQNLIERLAWTGPMLYDLCNARLQACRAGAVATAEGATAEAKPLNLLDLFAEDVTRQDLIDALDQMHQPRDAFKLLYQCLVEHCSNVSQEGASYRIPRSVLDNVRKQQVERVKQLYKGVRPA
jgi:hypothetical protein